jgi:peptide deformylase
LSLPVLKYPAPGLKRRTLPVDKIGEDIFRLVDDMLEAMINDDGLGLAANQIGSEARIFVMNTTPSEEEAKSLVFVNPVVLDQEGEIVDEEGCLSFPELYLKIARPQKVRVYAKDIYNEGFVIDLVGILARAAMHEMDHLNGILFIERAAAVEQEKVDKYLEEITKKV